MSLLIPGQVLTEVEIGPVAHGGHFIARVDGLVILVRHAITGELVDVRVTEVGRRFARGEVIAVHRPSPHRVAPPCAIAGRCGGCDFQHVEPAHARELKRQVVAELLAHQAGYEFTGEVAEVPPAPLGWRRRMRYHLDAEGRPGLLGHRSADVVALPGPGCLIADPSIAHPLADPGRPGGQVLAVAASSGSRFATPGRSRDEVRERVAGRDYRVRLDGFWQSHAAAPALLVEQVLAGLLPVAGETALDLYCGVGLFAGALADAGAHPWGIEADRRAVELARANVGEGRFFCGDVAATMGRVPARADLVVLDPPRAGAGQRVLTGIVARAPRRVAYVSCDPATLGRDLRTAGELGYRTVSVRAFDLFPMTHHVECLAILEPA